MGIFGFVWKSSVVGERGFVLRFFFGWRALAHIGTWRRCLQAIWFSKNAGEAAMSGLSL